MEQSKHERITSKNGSVTEEVITDTSLIEEANGELPAFYIGREIVPLSQINNSFFYNPDSENTFINILSEQKRIVLLGAAGQGKSEELKALARNLHRTEQPYIPVFKKLKHYKGELFEDYLPKGWQFLQEESCLFILDGLDEVPSNILTATITNILEFAERYKSASFIISCRSNFYDLPTDIKPGTLRDFSVFYLADLKLHQINAIGEKKFGDGSGFSNALVARNLHELATRPFFMQELIKIYDKRGQIPNRVELFEHILDTRLDLDSAHFVNARAISNEKALILGQLEKMASVMELMGVTAISGSDLDEIFREEGGFNLLKYGTAVTIKEGTKDTFQFEHNNIQEYLAATALMKLTQEQVFTIISNEHLTRVKPNWINTLAFFISIVREPKPYIDWLTVNDPEVLIRFEYDRLDESLRNSIFKGLFNHYSLHGFALMSKNFTYEDLAKFGESVEVKEFLIQKIENFDNNTTTLLNALRVLSYFEINMRNKKRIQQGLEPILFDGEHKEEVIAEAIKLYGKTNLDQQKISAIFEKYHTTKSDEVQKSLYILIEQNECADEYIDYLIEGASSGGSYSADTWDFSEPFELMCALKKIKSYDAAWKVISFLTKHNSSIDFSFYFWEDVLSVSIDIAASNFKKGDKAVFERLFEVLIEATSEYYLSRIIVFFKKTETRIKALVKIIKSSAEPLEKARLYSAIFIEELMDPLVNALKQGEVSLEEMKGFYKLISMSYEMDESHLPGYLQLIPEMVLNATGNIIQPYKYDEYDEGEEHRANLKLLSLFFDADELSNNIYAIFDEIGKDELELNDVKNVRLVYNTSSERKIRQNCLVIIRRKISRQSTISRGYFQNVFNNKVQRLYLQLSQIFRLVHSEHAPVANESQKRWLTEACADLLQGVDVASHITQKDSDNYTTSTLLNIIWKLYLKQLVQLPESILLDYTEYLDVSRNSYKTIPQILCEKLGLQKLSNRVVQNIRKGVKVPRVYLDNALFLIEHKIAPDFEQALEAILDSEIYTNGEKMQILKLYHKVSGDDGYLLDLAEDKKFYEIRWQLLDLVVKRGRNRDALMRVLERVLMNGPEDMDRVKACQYLVPLGNISAMNYILEKLVEPEYDVACFLELSKNVSRVTNRVMLNPLFDLKVAILSGQFTIANTHFFDDIDMAIIQIALQGHDTYEEVTNLIKTFEKKGLNEYAEQCFRDLARAVETQYLAKFSKQASLSSALALLNDFRRENSLNNYLIN
ncbi:NACHT domain-containing NTPase [Chitinophaga sp. S165]|uniref:NACHT domain-containing protein n=1 Tax=Chitinophaga sp. S165 TaxID=2135462 RepID=UPI000D71CB4E|nr:hypothetical protein [Chitinophaga sp. S165]PWV48893.1 hypothetical protein C7475_106139 [Chitinophaga sp. S165]